MGCPGWRHHPWRCSKNSWTLHSVPCSAWQGGVWSQAGHDDLRGFSSVPGSVILWTLSGAPPASRTPRHSKDNSGSLTPFLLLPCQGPAVPEGTRTGTEVPVPWEVSDLAQLLTALHRTCSPQEIQRLRAVPQLGPEVFLSPCSDCSNKFTVVAAENWLTNDSIYPDLSGPAGTCLQTQIQVSMFLYFIFSSLSFASSTCSTMALCFWHMQLLALPGSPDHCMAHMSKMAILYFSLFPSENWLPKMVLFSCRVS